MKVKSVREVRKQQEDTGFPEKNHVPSRQIVEEYTSAFLDLPLSDINFALLGINPLVKKIKDCYTRDGELIDELPDKGKQLIFDYLMGLNLDKADVTYTLRLRS